MTDVKDIRITDGFTKAQVERERIRRGDATPTKTAARLINERLAQIELSRMATGESAMGVMAMGEGRATA